MIKFDVFSRVAGAVQFTSEIEPRDKDLGSVKLGLAVRWAVKNDANLRDANLRGAYLRGANLRDANLRDANLRGANLIGAKLIGANLSCVNLLCANLSDANLRGANLIGANLSCVNLYCANLRGANLRDANLSDAHLRGAYLRGANLSDANLIGANLGGANLRDANLSGANGINDYVKCIQIERYSITYTADILQIGCKRHLISEWADFDDHRIAEMDGKGALKFWRKYKAWIFQTIEMCPAKPTVYVRPEAEI